MREGAEPREEGERPEAREHAARRRHGRRAVHSPRSAREKDKRHRVLLEVAEHAERGGVGDRRSRHAGADHKARRASVAPRVRKQHDRQRDERRRHAVDPARREQERVAEIHAAHERDQLADRRVHDEEERDIVVHRSTMLEQPPRLHRVVGGVHRRRQRRREVELRAQHHAERGDRERDEQGRPRPAEGEPRPAEGDPRPAGGLRRVGGFQWALGLGAHRWVRAWVGVAFRSIQRRDIHQSCIGCGTSRQTAAAAEAAPDFRRNPNG